MAGENDKPRGGRPYKFNEERAAKIVSYIRAGSFLHEAAAAAGVTKRTYNNWLSKGASADPKNARFRKFKDEVDQAIAMFRVVAVRKIAGSKDWRGPAHILALQDPKRYAVKTRIGIEFEDQKQQVLDAVKKELGHDAYLKVCAAVAAALSEKDNAPDDGGGSGDDYGEVID